MYEVRDPRKLTPHPEFERLFVPAERGEIERVRRAMAEGQPFQPLLVDAAGRVLAGVEQWQAALGLGWEAISVLVAPPLKLAELRALMVAENVRVREVREEHLWRGMNNFFDMEPLRPPGGW
ncbi:MAG: hypothetical protein ACOZHQ_11495 [Thermodesulfobacteriota bacterium]